MWIVSKFFDLGYVIVSSFGCLFILFFRQFGHVLTKYFTSFRIPGQIAFVCRISYVFLIPGWCKLCIVSMYLFFSCSGMIGLGLFLIDVSCQIPSICLSFSECLFGRFVIICCWKGLSSSFVKLGCMLISLISSSLDRASATEELQRQVANQKKAFQAELEEK